ncbi:thioredoxin family protein [Haloplanus aerogenes]|uniref:Thioredoxin n=1 Tax=Haloplanus aerogenes TaxID=660522 RepID=A0A3M0D2V4_9EURY|nr:thioredoxin family protein [Haloplanus aerogenes]AZH25134.1 thioredoxin [Haloplanus aerogenes]RMB13639.1 thiol-disulfide isomerase/thioredoxin [Haloplanus aerogenes]
MSGPSNAALEAALDSLIDTGLVDERDDGSLVTTEEFEATRRIYRDTYGSADDAAFRQTVADVFGVDEATAGERIDAGAITREDLVAYLSLRSALDNEASETPRETGEAGDSEELRSSGSRSETDDDDDVDDERLATMASLVAEISPGSPVPERVEELDDESWRAFLDDHPDAVVTVWRHDCAPCEALKEDLDAVLSELPDGVAVAGVDGESVPNFRRTFDVDSAPAVCCFCGGDLADTLTGRQSTDTYADRFAELY